MTELRHVAGLSPLLQTMRDFAPNFRKRVLRNSTAAGATVFRSFASEFAPEWHGAVSEGHPPPGTLKKSIMAYFVKEASNAQRVTFHIKPRSGDRDFTRKGSGGAVFDPTTGKRSRIRFTFSWTQTVHGAYYWWWVEFGSANNAPRHFMRSAFQVGAQAAIDAFASTAREGVFKLVQKGAARVS